MYCSIADVLTHGVNNDTDVIRRDIVKAQRAKKKNPTASVKSAQEIRDGHVVGAIEGAVEVIDAAAKKGGYKLPFEGIALRPVKTACAALAAESLGVNTHGVAGVFLRGIESGSLEIPNAERVKVSDPKKAKQKADDTKE